MYLERSGNRIAPRVILSAMISLALSELVIH